jgi:hypothetical protein
MPFEARMHDRNTAIHTRNDTLEMSDENAIHALKFARLGAAYAIELAKGDISTSVAAADDDDSPRWLAAILLLTVLALGYRLPRSTNA